MNFDKIGSKGSHEAVEHLTVLKASTKDTALVQDSPHDFEAQYGRSHAEQLRERADKITKGKSMSDLCLSCDNH